MRPGRKSARLLSLPLMLLAGAVSLAVPAAAQNSPGDVLALYGERIEFDIFRNGARIGTHRVSFAPEGDALRVKTDFKLEIGALFITLFELKYRSDALWDDGRLVSLAAETDRNGELTRVTATTGEDGLLVKGPNGVQTAKPGIYPTNHWNAGVIGSTELVNTITGNVNEVRLEPKGVETVPTNRGPVQATRYQYVGAIENEVWYDAEGRWVAMQFPGDDGSLIELRCRTCFPAQSAEMRP